MRVSLCCALAVCCVCVLSADPKAKGETGEDLSLLENCHRRCSRGGCLGKNAECKDRCYCYGSGYEGRCIKCWTPKGKLLEEEPHLYDKTIPRKLVPPGPNIIPQNESKENKLFISP